MKPIALVALPVLLFCVAMPATAAFRCTDKDGKTVYMERSCSTYGYVTAKELKDPPKGDGSATSLRSGTRMITSQGDPTAKEDRRFLLPMKCGTERIMCKRGETIMCAGSSKVCAGD
jgi:hypothetical protein